MILRKKSFFSLCINMKLKKNLIAVVRERLVAKGVPESVCLHLNEQKAAILDRVAVLADEFAVTHKVSFVVYHQRGRGTGLFPKTQTGSASRRPAAASSSDRLCFYCKKSGPIIADCALLHKKKKKTEIG